jgi:TPR repeat protein
MATAKPAWRTWLLAAVCIAGMTMASARADTFSDGLSAYNIGDYAIAYAIWLPLAKQGHANARSAIGYLFYDGRGVRQNREEAARWYELAARDGEATAQSFLCRMHLQGDGVPRDLEQALMWCELSMQGGEVRATHLRERVMRQMTMAQRDSAWKLVLQWNERQESHPAPDAGAPAGRP